MKRFIRIFAMSVLAVSCAQKADEPTGSDSAGLSAPTKVLGKVLTCKSGDKILSSLQLERGIGGRIWLKGRVIDNVGVPLDVNAMVSKIAVSGNKRNHPSFNLDQGKDTLKAPPTDDEGYKGYVRSLASLAWNGDSVILENFDNSQHTLAGKCSSPSLILTESTSASVKPKLLWPELEPILQVGCGDRGYVYPVRAIVNGRVCVPNGSWR
jgi:hypothetical protein